MRQKVLKLLNICKYWCIHIKNVSVHPHSTEIHHVWDIYNNKKFRPIVSIIISSAPSLFVANWSSSQHMSSLDIWAMSIYIFCILCPFSGLYVTPFLGYIMKNRDVNEIPLTNERTTFYLWTYISWLILSLDILTYSLINKMDCLYQLISLISTNYHISSTTTIM